MQIDQKLDCAIDAGDMKNVHLGKMLELGKKLYMRSLVIHIVLYFARRTLLLLRWFLFINETINNHTRTHTV